MDRRSWLWRRKSSDKSPAETDSSGSFSSHSERFSDDQVYGSHNSQAPEVTSKAVSGGEEINEDVNILREKLSSALLDVSVKEDLVKQHAKVAEEAVSGWEKAEKELLSLRQQLEASIKKNSALENRVVQLDGALKECVRQLRQSREEQEQRINQSVARKTYEWESMKSDLESKLKELQDQLLIAKTGAVALANSDLRLKLEAAEKDNSSLERQLLSQADELEIRIMERDLSAQAAETASKQHLESIKKVAKLEAECCRLKTMVHKSLQANDNKSLVASSIYVESFTDSLSDSGERQLVANNDAHKISGLEIECQASFGSWSSALISELDQFKNLKTKGRNVMGPSREIDLMDDFLEMERILALPDTEGGISHLDRANGSESPWKAEKRVMIHRTTELEERLKKLEQEKDEIQHALSKCQRQLEMSESLLKGADAKLLELQSELALACNVKRQREEEMESVKSKRELAKSRLLVVEAENRSLLSRVGLLSADVEKERAFSSETLDKCQKLEDELSKAKHEAELQYEAELKHTTIFNEGLKIKQDKELADAASKFAECQRTISSLSHQLKSLAAMEDFLVDSVKS